MAEKHIFLCKSSEVFFQDDFKMSVLEKNPRWLT